MTDKKYYTIEEFVDRLQQAGLRFSVRTVRHWIKTGKIKAVKPGFRQWYIPVEEFDRLLQGPVSGRRTISLAPAVQPNS